MFWTEGGLISAYRPEHRWNHPTGGHPRVKSHTENIFRAVTSPRNNIEATVVLSIAAPRQNNHPMLPLHKQGCAPSTLRRIVSFDPQDETGAGPKEVGNPFWHLEKLIVRGPVLCSRVLGLVNLELRSSDVKLSIPWHLPTPKEVYQVGEMLPSRSMKKYKTDTLIFERV